MARAVDPDFRRWADAARAMPIGDLAEQRGLRLRGRVERVGPCPDCGGTDRFGINTVKGVFLCRRCGAKGDVIALVQLLDGCDFLRACETLTGIEPPIGAGHGLSAEDLAQLERDRADRRAAQAAEADKYREAERRRLFKLWRQAEPAIATPAEAYLNLRGVTLPNGRALRFLPDAKLYADGKAGASIVHVGPAMLAAIVGPDGRFAGLHMTWIDLADRTGKAHVADPATGEILPAKKVRGSQRGGSIRLVEVDEPRRLTIGEGIETVLSVRDALMEAGRDLADMAFWSAINLGNLGGPSAGTVAHPELKTEAGRPQNIPGPLPELTGLAIPIPDSVDEIVILGDGDSDPFTTETTLARAARRWARPGRAIRATTAPAGSDFNNLRRGVR